MSAPETGPPLYKGTFSLGMSYKMHCAVPGIIAISYIWVLMCPCVQPENFPGKIPAHIAEVLFLPLKFPIHGQAGMQVSSYVV